MKPNLFKTLLLAATLLVGGANYAWAYTPTLTNSYVVAGYQSKAYYNIANTNVDGMCPTGGDLVFRGDGFGLYNYGSGNRGADVTLSVASGDIIIFEFQDSQARSSTINSVSNCTKNETLSGTYLVYDVNTTASSVNVNVGRAGCIIAILVMESTGTPTHNYTINAVSGGATIGKLAEGIAEESTEYSTYIPKYQKYNDQYYVLNDVNISNYFANYTMGQSDETKEINYSSSDIDYFFEAEEMTLSRHYGDNSNNAAYSKGAGKGVYASATLTSTSKVAAGVYTVAVTGVVRNSKKDVNFSISYSSKGGTWWSTSKNVTYQTNSSGATTGSVTEVVIPAESYIRLTEATGSNVNDYTDYVTLEKTRNLSAVEIAVIDCKRYDTSAAFATAIDAESFSTAAEVYAFNTSYHITNGVLTDGVRDITGVIRNAQVNDADATDWDGAGTYNAELYEGAPDPYFIDNNGSNMWATQDIYGLPAGQYLVKVATRGAAANYNHIYISNGTADIAQVEGNHVGNTGGDLTNGWSWTYVPFAITEPTNLIFGFYKNATNWAGCDDWHLYRIESVNGTITSAGWATLYTPYALDFSGVAGLTAYTASLDESTVTLTPVDDVPANTGVVLQGDAGTYDIPVIASSSTAKGDLQGDAVNATVVDAANKYYALSYVSATNKVQFNPVANGQSIAAGKAYLVDESGLAAKAFTVEFAGADAINTVQGSGFKVQDSEIFNLAGQRMSKLQRGVNIVNGKKVLVK